MESNTKTRIQEITRMFADLTRSGVQLHQIYALTKKDMGIIFELAHNMYLEGRYNEAKETVTTLCWLHNNNVIYWKALAAVNEKLGDFQGAENACSMIMMLEPDNHESYLDLVRYAHKLKHFNVVNSCLQHALELATQQKKGSVIIKQIEAQLAENEASQTGKHYG